MSYHLVIILKQNRQLETKIEKIIYLIKNTETKT